MRAAILVRGIFPTILLTAWRQSQFVVIDMDFEERLERLWQEYVVERYLKTLAFFGASW